MGNTHMSFYKIDTNNNGTENPLTEYPGTFLRNTVGASNCGGSQQLRDCGTIGYRPLSGVLRNTAPGTNKNLLKCICCDAYNNSFNPALGTKSNEQKGPQEAALDVNDRGHSSRNVEEDYQSNEETLQELSKTHTAQPEEKGKHNSVGKKEIPAPKAGNDIKTIYARSVPLKYSGLENNKVLPDKNTTIANNVPPVKPIRSSLKSKTVSVSKLSTVIDENVDALSTVPAQQNPSAVDTSTVSKSNEPSILEFDQTEIPASKIPLLKSKTVSVQKELSVSQKSDALSTYQNPSKIETNTVHESEYLVSKIPSLKSKAASVLKRSSDGLPSQETELLDKSKLPKSNARSLIVETEKSASNISNALVGEKVQSVVDQPDSNSDKTEDVIQQNQAVDNTQISSALIEQNKPFVNKTQIDLSNIQNAPTEEHYSYGNKSTPMSETEIQNIDNHSGMLIASRLAKIQDGSEVPKEQQSSSLENNTKPESSLKLTVDSIEEKSSTIAIINDENLPITQSPSTAEDKSNAPSFLEFDEIESSSNDISMKDQNDPKHNSELNAPVDRNEALSEEAPNAQSNILDTPQEGIKKFIDSSGESEKIPVPNTENPLANEPLVSTNNLVLMEEKAPSDQNVVPSQSLQSKFSSHTGLISKHSSVLAKYDALTAKQDPSIMAISKLESESNEPSMLEFDETAEISVSKILPLNSKAGSILNVSLKPSTIPALENALSKNMKGSQEPSRFEFDETDDSMIETNPEEVQPISDPRASSLEDHLPSKSDEPSLLEMDETESTISEFPFAFMNSNDRPNIQNASLPLKPSKIPIATSTTYVSTKSVKTITSASTGLSYPGKQNKINPVKTTVSNVGEFRPVKGIITKGTNAKCSSDKSKISKSTNCAPNTTQSATQMSSSSLKAKGACQPKQFSNPQCKDSNQKAKPHILETYLPMILFLSLAAFISVFAFK